MHHIKGGEMDNVGQRKAAREREYHKKQYEND
jgi:hypothetical protein